MHKRKKIRFAIFAIAAVMLLTAISGHGQHAAWMQGYATGIATAADAAAEGSAAAAPMVAHAEMARHGMHGGFWVLGAIVAGIFKIGFFLLMLAFFAKVFGFMMWRFAAGGGPSWGGYDGWNRDEMRKKWRDHKRAWAKKHGYTSDSSDESSSDDGSDDENDEPRPAEERFVV